MAEIFKTLKEPDKTKFVWIYSLLATIVTFAATWLLSTIEHGSFNGTGSLIPAIYLMISAALVNRF